jgi:hypothetical protein
MIGRGMEVLGYIRHRKSLISGSSHTVHMGALSIMADGEGYE